MKAAAFVAIAAAIGNFLQGWDNACIAGTFPVPSSNYQFLVSSRKNYHQFLFLKFEFTPGKDSGGFYIAQVGWYIQLSIHLLLNSQSSVIFMQSNLILRNYSFQWLAS